MLLQTNSYIVPKERRAEHARLLRRFRSILSRLGCDQFDVYEQMGPNWNTAEATGRFVQIMRFRDRKHQRAVHAAEQTDPAAQQLINEFCELINLPYQQQQGLLAIGYYNAVPEASAGKPRAAAAAPAVEPPPPPRRPTMSAGFGFTGPAAGAAALSAAIPPYGTTEDEEDLAAEQASDAAQQTSEEIDAAGVSAAEAWPADVQPPAPADAGPTTVVSEVGWAEPGAEDATLTALPADAGTDTPAVPTDAGTESGALGDDLPAWEELANQPEDAPPAVAPVMAGHGAGSEPAGYATSDGGGPISESFAPARPDESVPDDRVNEVSAAEGGASDDAVAAEAAAEPFDVDDLLSEWGGAGGDERASGGEVHAAAIDAPSGLPTDDVETASAASPGRAAGDADAFDLPDRMPEGHRPADPGETELTPPTATGAQEGNFTWSESDRAPAAHSDTAGAEGDADAFAEGSLLDSRSETGPEGSVSTPMSELQSSGPEAGVDDLAAFAIGQPEEDRAGTVPGEEAEPAALVDNLATDVGTAHPIDLLEPASAAGTDASTDAGASPLDAAEAFASADGLPTRLSTEEGEIEIVFESIPEGFSGPALEGDSIGEHERGAYELDAVFDEALSGERR